MPARNIRIFLVRHAQSESNLDKTVNLRQPDHSVRLSAAGIEQAKAAGAALVEYWKRLPPSGRVRILCSPYERTRHTSAMLEDAMERAGITFDKRQALELRELNFGLFDGVPDDELPQLYPREYAHYSKNLKFEGEFFAHTPMGESRCNVADRVKGIFGTILRDADQQRPDPITDFVVVTHGVTLRCFRLQWMHYDWKWYQGQPNPNNASIQLIQQSDGRYVDFQLFEGFKSPRSSQERREDGLITALLKNPKP